MTWSWSSPSGPVVWEEIEGSPNFSISRAGNSVTRMFKVNGDEDELIYFMQTLASGDGTFPAESVVLSNVLLTGMTAEPWESATKKDDSISNPQSHAGSARYWKVTAQYELYQFNKTWPTSIPKPGHDSGTLLQFRTRTSGQWLTMSSRDVEYDDGNGQAAPDTDYRLIILVREMVIDWLNVYNPPFNKIDSCIGHSNHNTFLGAPAGTLLYLRVESRLPI